MPSLKTSIAERHCYFVDSSITKVVSIVDLRTFAAQCPPELSSRMRQDLSLRFSSSQCPHPYVLQPPPIVVSDAAGHLLLTLTGKPSSIGKVRLFWLFLSPPLPQSLSFFAITSVISYLHVKRARTATAKSSASFLPRQILGPPLKTGNSKADFCRLIEPAALSHRSGLNCSESSPQMRCERPMAQGTQITTDPFGSHVPSGNVVGATHSLSSKGTGGQRRRVSEKTECV